MMNAIDIFGVVRGSAGVASEQDKNKTAKSKSDEPATAS
jgi:hypothetical protein